MTGAIPLDVRVGQSFADPHEVDDRPPGERYFRHPGDLVRLVLWGVCLVVLAIFISVATATSDGVTSDLGRAAGRVAVSVREFTLALNQVVAAGVRSTQGRLKTVVTTIVVRAPELPHKAARHAEHLCSADERCSDRRGKILCNQINSTDKCERAARALEKSSNVCESHVTCAE